MNLGGVPLSLPVVREGTTWRTETSTSAYHKKLGITQAFAVDGATIASYRTSGLAEDPRLRADEVLELYVRFTGTKDIPSEDGSAGPRDAALRDRRRGPRRQAGTRRRPGRRHRPSSGTVRRRTLGPGELSRDDRRCRHPFAPDVRRRHRLVGAHRPDVLRLLPSRGGPVGFRAISPAARSGAGARFGSVPGGGLRQPEKTQGALDRACGDRRDSLGRSRPRSRASPARILRGPGLASRPLGAPGKPSRLRHTTGFWIFDRSLLEQGAPFTTGNSSSCATGRRTPSPGRRTWAPTCIGSSSSSRTRPCGTRTSPRCANPA